MKDTEPFPIQPTYRFLSDIFRNGFFTVQKCFLSQEVPQKTLETDLVILLVFLAAQSHPTFATLLNRYKTEKTKQRNPKTSRLLVKIRKDRLYVSKLPFSFLTFMSILIKLAKPQIFSFFGVKNKERGRNMCF